MGRSMRDLTTQEERAQMVIDRENYLKTLPSYRSKLQEYLSLPNVKEFNRELRNRGFSNCGNTPLGRPRALVDRETCLRELSAFFELCDRCKVIPTVTGMFTFLGTDRDTIYYTMNDKTCEFSDLVKQAVNTCHISNEMGAIDGSISSSLYIFLSKNYYGMKDTSDIQITPVQNNVIDTNNTMRIIQEQLALENQGTEIKQIEQENVT